MYTSILSDFTTINTDFKNMLQSFSEKHFFTSPAAGSWSAAEVAEHVILSDTAMHKFMSGDSAPSDRSPDAHVEGLKNTFLNFDIKMNSPSFIIPKGIFKTQTEAITSFENIVDALQKAKDELDLSRSSLAIEAVELKGLTRLELLYFTIVHTQRHVHQLQKIAVAVKG